MTTHHDVVAAFADNEPVDAAALDAALADASARAHLIDILVLRGLVGDALQPHAAGAAGGTRPTPNVRNGQVTDAAHRMPRGVWLSAAAALMAVGLAAGFAAGRHVPGPAPDRSVSSEVIGEGTVVPKNSAPAPTHVIHLERGVDWNERTGGN